uniref:Uncharacterized protein n=1 Tax=Oryza barthii TaxID=65489 RepID=A0A0D3F6L7_9ORYZ
MRRRWLGGKRGGGGGPTAREVAAAPSPPLHQVGGDTTVAWRLRRHRVLCQIWREGRGCGGDPATRGAAVRRESRPSSPSGDGGYPLQWQRWW